MKNSNEQNKSKKVLVNQIPDKVMFDFNLSLGSRLIYGYLNSLSYKTGFCFSSNGYIAERFQMHKITVAKFIAELEKAGYIKMYYDDTEKNNSKRKIYIQKVIENHNEDVKKPLRYRILLEKFPKRKGGGVSQSANTVLANPLTPYKPIRYDRISESANQVLSSSINKRISSLALAEETPLTEINKPACTIEDFTTEVKSELKTEKKVCFDNFFEIGKCSNDIPFSIEVKEQQLGDFYFIEEKGKDELFMNESEPTINKEIVNSVEKSVEVLTDIEINNNFIQEDKKSPKASMENKNEEKPAEANLVIKEKENMETTTFRNTYKPTLKETITLFNQKGIQGSEEASAWFSHMENKGWVDTTNRPISNWKIYAGFRIKDILLGITSPSIEKQKVISSHDNNSVKKPESTLSLFSKHIAEVQFKQKGSIDFTFQTNIYSYFLSLQKEGLSEIETLSSFIKKCGSYTDDNGFVPKTSLEGEKFTWPNIAIELK